MCFSHSSSLRSGIVGAEVRAAALLAVDRGDDGRLGAVDHVAELDRADQVLVEDRAVVVDRHPLVLLLQPLHRLERLLQAGLLAEDGARACPSSVPSSSFSSDTRRALPGSRPISSRDLPLLVARAPRRTAGSAPCSRARSAACAPERRPNTSVSSSEFAPRRLPPCTDTHAHSPAAYRPGNLGLAVHVGLHAAHHVVVAGLDVDRLLGDVDARRSRGPR